MSLTNSQTWDSAISYRKQKRIITRCVSLRHGALTSTLLKISVLLVIVKLDVGAVLDICAPKDTFEKHVRSRDNHAMSVTNIYRSSVGHSDMVFVFSFFLNPLQLAGTTRALISSQNVMK